MSVYCSFGIYGRDLDFGGKTVGELRTLWRDLMQDFDTFMKRRPVLSQDDFVFIVERDGSKRFVINEAFVLQDGDRCHLERKWPRLPSTPRPQLTLEERVRRWFTIQKNRLRILVNQ